MKQLKLFIILFLLFLTQGTILTRLPFGTIWKPVQIVPDFLFVALLMVSFFAGSKLGMRYAVFFGLLTDLIYTSVIGVYAFSMTLAVYLVSSAARWLNLNTATVMLLTGLGVCLLQAEVYVIYLTIGLTAQQPLDFLRWRLPATFLLNAVFALAIYHPFHRFLRSMAELDEK
ncbi:rod shape-determining protein MreD [Sporolactobacillus putidus]|uniref:Rod shape-determining protein MreD n=1 Tax=Sporolactobacillus putidus TaxID=492735 RepID=A0A917VZ12_9BACL|nr:rod shape-determining protein MreD [Sporolactobacillus putidus]GGL41249.1 hypothetical protein GCM10007968_01400 [Sporolactobacillus putidus]